MAEVRVKPEGAPAQPKGAGQVLKSVLNELEKSIVYIETPDLKGTGSIVKFEDQPWLMTCNHVIPTKDIARKSCIFFDKDDADDKPGDKPGIMVKGADLFCSEKRWFLTSPSEPNSLDVTLITIKMDKVPKFDGQQRLELDLSVYKGLEPTFSLREQDEVMLWHYPEKGNFGLHFSPYITNAVSGHLFTHSAETHRGSSGAPVFKICENKPVVVGLHRGALVNWDPPGLNVATCIHAIWCLLKRTDHGLGEVDWKAFSKKDICVSKAASLGRPQPHRSQSQLASPSENNPMFNAKHVFSDYFKKKNPTAVVTEEAQDGREGLFVYSLRVVFSGCDYSARSGECQKKDDAKEDACAKMITAMRENGVSVPQPTATPVVPILAGPPVQVLAASEDCSVLRPQPPPPQPLVVGVDSLHVSCTEESQRLQKPTACGVVAREIQQVAVAVDKGGKPHSKVLHEFKDKYASASRCSLDLKGEPTGREGAFSCQLTLVLPNGFQLVSNDNVTAGSKKQAKEAACKYLVEQLVKKGYLELL